MSSLTLRSFLFKLKQLPLGSRLKLVTGNESADFDSVTSALSYSFYQYVKNETIIYPLINIPRADLALRKDILNTLEDEYKVTTDMLFFLEDLRQWRQEKIEIDAILVDHNQLVNESGELINDVRGVIDHHEDLKLHLDANPRIVETCGSCSSLVFKYWYEQIGSLDKMTEMIYLLRGAVMLDTANFKHKMEPTDIEMWQIYAKASPMTEEEAEQYFKHLKKLKKDIKGLPLRDVFRKDYKQFEMTTTSHGSIKVGIASLVKSINWIYKHYEGPDNVRKVCQDFIQEFDIDAIMLMASYSKKDTFKRQMVIVPSERLAAMEIIPQTIQSISGTLQLQPLESEEVRTTHVDPTAPPLYEFDQLNTHASRKLMVPVLKQALLSL